jgi:UDP-2,4-diacetamido-2,4,6-trideoxy-beta-L-altropyranose hydrolase
MNLLFRTDASVAIGTGHVMRCLALSQAWRDAGAGQAAVRRAVFAMAEATPAIRARLAAESCDVISVSCAAAGTLDDSAQTIALAREQKADWIVVDGYRFAADYQGALKDAGFRVLFLDDYGHADHYSADIVLNQNAHANEGMYQSREPYTRLLLGTRYCLLRREFAAWRGWTRNIAPVGRKVLVTLGGSDPENITGMVMEGLCQLHDIEATVVVGGSSPHFERLRRGASQLSGWLRLQQGVNNMPELMAWADAAVAGAGSTCWEMSLLQLPMALIDIAENQQPIARALHDLGAAIHLGTAGTVTKAELANRVKDLLDSESKRATLSGRCAKLVDGRGAARVSSELSRD